MRVSERTSALVIMPISWCGRVVLALHETRIDPNLGTLWRCRSRGQEQDLPELTILALEIRGAEDPGARELLPDNEKAAWDEFHMPPDINF